MIPDIFENGEEEAKPTFNAQIQLPFAGTSSQSSF